MGEKRSAWILCPSKKFPGKFYYFNTQNGEKAWSWTDNTRHTESREDVSPTITNNNFVDKTQSRFKEMPNYPDSSRPSSILHNESEEFSSSMLSNNHFVNNTQEKCKPTPNNPFLWRQSRQLHSECREYNNNSPISNSLIGDAQTSWKLMPNNPLSSRQANKFDTKFKKFGSQTTNSSCVSGNIQLKDKLGQNNLSSGIRKRLYKETMGFSSSATSSKFSCRSQATFKLMQNNPVLLRQPKQLHTQPIKFDSNKRYKPLHGNPFSEDHGQAKKRTRIDTQFASPLMSLDVVDQISNNSSSTTINHYRNDNMKIVIDIKFLRNLSKSELVKEWHIVPDVDVLLENLDFLKEFIAADPTCTMMAPAAVLKKLQSLEDSRATVAEQVYQWLAKHSVCEINNQDEFLLNDTSINEQIIKFCVEAKILHVVIITKQENLRNAARNNGLHAYFISELKITKQCLGDKNHKDNLFLQSLDNLDPFLISKSVQSMNISSSDELTYDINENSNNTTNNNLSRLKLNPPRMPNVSSYQITRSQHNNVRDRTIFNSQNFEKSNQNKYIDPPSSFMRNIRIDTNTNPVEDEESEENLTLKSDSQKSDNRFEGFRHHTRFANATNVFHNVTNKNQSVVEPNSKTQINWFKGLKDASIGTNVFNKISVDRNKKQNVIKAKKRKKHNKSESIKFNTPIKTNVFNNKSSARNREDKDVLPKVPELYNQFGGITFSAPIEMSNFTDDDESVFPKICNTNEIQNGVNLSARGQTNASNKTSVSQKNPYQSNENQSAKKPNAQNDNHFEVVISNENLDSNACMDQTSNVHEDDEMIEGQLRDFCTKHYKLQNCINDRVDEWSCCFVQIMEQFLDDVFQKTPVEKFDPPYWFQQGLKCLREYYSQNKYIGTVIDKLIGLCGYCIKNGIVRTNMRADKFLKILGAGILLIERIDKIAQFPEISEFYKEMLYHLVTTIQDPGDFPEMLCLNMEFSLRIGDEAFRIENCEGEGELKS